MVNKQKLRKEEGPARKSQIPVIVDNIVNLPSYNMVRFIYFSIDSTDNPKSYKLKAGHSSIPVWIIGFQGIIHAPLTGSVFNRPEAIERLFDAVEESGDFFVDTNDLWLPVTLFDKNPKRGEVYRVTKDLFSLAIKFRNDRIESAEFVHMTEKLKSHVLYSIRETRAFQDWSHLKIKEAKEIYPKDEELKLSYVES